MHHDDRVIAGVILAALIFAWKLLVISASSTFRPDGVKVYTVKGQLFFGTMSAFIGLFDYAGDPERVRIDFTHSNVWDQSAVEAIARVVHRYQQQGKSVYVIGLNPESQETLDRGFS